MLAWPFGPGFPGFTLGLEFGHSALNAMTKPLRPGGTVDR
jgi:hypothetical protein